MYVYVPDGKSLVPRGCTHDKNRAKKKKKNNLLPTSLGSRPPILTKKIAKICYASIAAHAATSRRVNRYEPALRDH